MTVRGSFPRMLASLRHDTRGTMLIETALVTPVLVLMSIGSFEASQMYARESELQTAASEAAAIALAAPPNDATKRTTLRNILKTSTGLASTGVTVAAEYRCGTSTAYVTSNTTCGTQTVSNFVRINLIDTYTPTWTQIGIGGSVTFRVTRYVMIGQT